MPIKYRAGYKYQLAEDYFFQTDIKEFKISTAFVTLDEFGLLIIKKGYAWNGPINAMWSGIITFIIKKLIRPSLLHDCLYQLIRLKLLPREYRLHADKIFRQECVNSGMYPWLADFCYKNVRNFAAYAIDPKEEPPILEAP